MHIWKRGVAAVSVVYAMFVSLGIYRTVTLTLAVKADVSKFEKNCYCNFTDNYPNTQGT